MTGSPAPPTAARRRRPIAPAGAASSRHEDAVPAFLSPPGEPSTAATMGDVQALAAWILDPERKRPIVALSSRNHHRDPYFPAGWVQRLVGDAADVVAIRQSEQSRLTVELDHRLPDGLMVFNGAARIFWPVKLVGKDPRRHPLILADRQLTAGDIQREKLERRWRQGPEDERRPPAPRPATPPARTVRPTAPARPAVASGPRQVGAGEDELRLEVTRAWLALLPDPVDRNRFGLQPYRLGADLAAQLETLEPARAPVAAAAACILSGYAWTQTAPVPQRVERGGSPVLRDRDHAVAWRYPLAGSDRVLFYWQPASGPIVLARIGDPGRPELLHSLPAAAPASDVSAPRPRRPAAEAPKVETVPTSTETVAEQPRTQRLVVADDELVRAVQAAERPVSAQELRVALAIDPDVSTPRFTRLLGDAVERGLLQRTGQARGTRYSAV